MVNQQSPSAQPSPSEQEVAFRPRTPPSRPLTQVLDAAGEGARLVGASGRGTVVDGVCLDSRAVQPGDLYAALPGARTHGAEHASQALERGAVAVFTDPAGEEALGQDVAVPVIVVADPRSALGDVAAAVYDTRRRAPETFAVTGTNGKTTTTYLLHSLLAGLGRTPGLIGTIEILAGGTRIPSVLTTPEAPQLHALMSRMREEGVDAVAMEASSHALAFRRVAGLRFAVSGFTNLTQDHLDLHGSMEGYLAAKAELFTPTYSGRAVITVDSEFGVTMAERSAEAGIPTATLATGAGKGVDAEAAGADHAVTAVHRDGLGHRFTLVSPGGVQLHARTGLPGEFNVSNAALALAMLLEAGVEPERLAGLLEAEPEVLTPSVPGRMQVIHTRPTAIVDFAHNPDALVRALSSVRTDTGRVIVVFGATGERDTTKRPVMGAVAARHADVVIVTDDDPHGEDPAPIREQVMAGALDAAGAAVEVIEVAPRADAIAEAVARARPDDVIVVAGRGHESWQEIAGVNHALDDREELRAAFSNTVRPSGDGTGAE